MKTEESGAGGFASVPDSFFMLQIGDSKIQDSRFKNSKQPSAIFFPLSGCITGAPVETRRIASPCERFKDSRFKIQNSPSPYFSPSPAASQVRP
jgi:hypothetical protein